MEYNKKNNLYKVVDIEEDFEEDVEVYTSREEALKVAKRYWNNLCNADKHRKCIEVRQCNKKDYLEDEEYFSNYNTIKMFVM